MHKRATPTLQIGMGQASALATTAAMQAIGRLATTARIPWLKPHLSKRFSTGYFPESTRHLVRAVAVVVVVVAVAVFGAAAVVAIVAYIPSIL